MDPRAAGAGAVLRRLAAIIMALTLPTSAGAHDPSNYGGLYRSRALGESWLNADVGLFLNAVLCVAVDPVDSTHLLMGTDLGIQRSRDGGRSWVPEAPNMIVGAVFAIAFAPSGRSALVAAPSGIFRFADGSWTRSKAPADAAPGRTIQYRSGDDRVVLLGRTRLFESRDGGRSFTRLADSLPPSAQISAWAIAERATPGRQVAIVDSHLMASGDEGRTWRRLAADHEGPIDALALDPASPTRLWFGGSNRVHLSDDLGASWRTIGERLPLLGTVRGIVADGAATRLTITSNRGLFSSVDGGTTWVQREGTLPVHIESGPLFRDPSEAQTLYSVFALKPYPELWRKAVEDGDRLAPRDHLDRIAALAIGAAMLMVLGLRFGHRLFVRIAKQRAA